MKGIFGLVVITLIVCIGMSSVCAEVSSVPDLKGNWTGTSVGHEAKDGYIGEGTFNYNFVVEEQKGRVFNGTLFETGKDGEKTYFYSGIIAHDMKTLNIVEHGTGHEIGYLISDTEMELILQVSEEDGLAELVTLKKSE